MEMIQRLSRICTITLLLSLTFYSCANVTIDSGVDDNPNNSNTPNTSDENLGLGQIGPDPQGGHTAQSTNPYGRTDYFISPSGNDSNSGTSVTSPFQTLAKLGTIPLEPGNRVFFERGGIYRGSVAIYNRDGTSEMPIIISAYGEGEAPIISGARPITNNWVLHSGNIYKADVGPSQDYIYSNPAASGSYVPYSTKVPFVFFNRKNQTLARFPNIDNDDPSGSWLYKDIYTTSHTNQSQGWYYLKDSNLPSIPGGGSWVGADVITRTTNWSFITGYAEENSSGLLTINVKKFNNYQSAPAPGWSSMANWGYFLQDKLGLLDQAGEWYYDRSTNKLYFWQPGGGKPSAGSVEYAVDDTGIEIGSDSGHFIIENLDLMYYRKIAIKIGQNSSGIIVRNNRFSNGMKGISIGSGDVGFKLTRNKFEDLWEMAIHVFGSNGITISHNWLENICLIPGMVRSTWSYVAASVGSASSSTTPYLVKDNYMNNVGYIGWAASGSGTIERNLVEHAGIILNDGANITYDYIPYDGLLLIKDNMMLDSLGDLTSVSPSIGANYETKWMGAYTGDKAANNIVVDGNTIENMGRAGIWVDHTKTFNASNQLVSSFGQIQRNNKIFNNPIGIGKTDFSQYHHFDFSTGTILTTDCGSRANTPCFTPNFDEAVYGNEIYSTKSSQYGLYELKTYSNGTSQLTDYGDYHDNKYFHPTNPSNTYLMKNESGNGVIDQHKTLQQWKSTGKDVGSTSTSGVSNLAPASSRGRLIKNRSWNTVTFKVSDGTLESCLYKLDGTPLQDSLQLGPLESVIAEKGCSETN